MCVLHGHSMTTDTCCALCGLNDSDIAVASQFGGDAYSENQEICCILFSTYEVCLYGGQILFPTKIYGKQQDKKI